MLVSVLLSLVTLAASKPPPYLKEDSIYDNLPYLIDRIQVSNDSLLCHNTGASYLQWVGQ